MSRMVNCVLLGTEAEGMDYAPYPGDLGVRIYENVSRQAWQQWLAHQTMLINEYRLTPFEPKARKFLEEEMEKFFFGEGSTRPEGYVAEGSGENIFVVRDGVIYTPETTTALNGITRKTIFKLAADQGLQIIERRFTRDEIYIADEAFFTGTAAEVTPIAELDNRPVGSGSRGPITERLQSDYFDLCMGATKIISTF